jgi:hypothetical protein
MTRRQTVVPVLGMHRSGTSLTTRALNLMGMELGWPLQPAGPDNTKGFWEHLTLQTHNRELLASVGAPTTGWGTQTQLRRAAAEVAQIVPREVWWRPILAMLERQFRSPLWGIKDPRLVITWPFWRRFLQSHGWTDIRPVVVTRHPAAVLKSVLTRGDLDQMAVAAGTTPANLFLQCWTTYYSLILSSAGGGPPPVFLTQEDLLDPATSAYDLERVCAAIGGDPRSIDAALHWVDPKMDHRSATIKIPEDVESAYQRLRGMARKQRESWMDGRSPRVVLPPAPAPSLHVPEGVERPQAGLYAHVVAAVAHLHPQLADLSSQGPAPISFLSVSGLIDTKLPADGTLVVNLDRVAPGTAGYSEEFVQVLRRYSVLEPRQEQISTLLRLGIRATYLPLAFPPMAQDRPPTAERSVDVLIYGGMSERRENLAQSLQRAGLHTLVVTNTVGEALVELIRDAKVVLQILHAPWHQISAVRLSLPASVGTMVLAERGLGQVANLSDDPRCEWAHYDELVARTSEAVRSGAWRSRGAATLAHIKATFPDTAAQSLVSLRLAAAMEPNP